MATLASSLSSRLLLPRHRFRNHHNLHLLHNALSSSSILSPLICSAPRKIRSPVISSSSAGAPSDEINWSEDSIPDNPFKKSALSALIHEIEPLDVSLIQKDVPLTTIDAMKRTISGMLGLLPSDQFQVYIEALWEPLSKLLVSSMMTGYTLRNAEHRLCLEKNLDMHEQNPEHKTADGSKLDIPEILLDGAKKINLSEENELSFKNNLEDAALEIDIKELGDIPHEAQQYILHLQSQLLSAKRELREVKRKNAAFQMQQFDGEEKNDLLGYLRSLQPEKVVELSESTSPELKETIHFVVHGLLATLSPIMHSTAPPNTSVGKASAISEDCAELVENTSLHFRPLISLTRGYLARLLFWCMLLGHYLGGLEYRLALVELLSLTAKGQSDIPSSEQVT